MPQGALQATVAVKAGVAKPLVLDTNDNLKVAVQSSVLAGSSAFHATGNTSGGSAAVATGPGVLDGVYINKGGNGTTVTIADGATTLAVIDGTTKGQENFGIAFAGNLTATILNAGAPAADVTVTYRT